MFHNTRFGRKIFIRDLQEGEDILYVGHVHTIVLIKDLTLYLIIGIAIPYILTLSHDNVAILIAGIMAICSFIRFYIKFLLWYFDCWVITEKGIIDYYWKNIFNKTVIRIEYGSFEGLAHEISGFWNTVLNKGTILVVKALDHHEVSLKNASNPKYIEQMILHAQKSHEHLHSAQRNANKQEMIQTLLAEMLANYAKEKGVDLD